MKPQETLDYHVKLVWHNMVNLYNQLASKHDLTQASGFVLLNIDEKKGTPATKIAPLMGMKNTSLSRLLKRMEEEGMICRKSDLKDGRLVKIHLTKKGKVKKEIAKKVVVEYNNFLLQSINPNDLACYYQVMQSINQLTEEYKSKINGHEQPKNK